VSKLHLTIKQAKTLNYSFFILVKKTLEQNSTNILCVDLKKILNHFKLNILLISYPDKILTFYEFTILIERKNEEKKRGFLL